MEIQESSVTPWTSSTTIATLVIVTFSLIIYTWWRHPLYGQNRGPKIFPIVGCLPQALMSYDRAYDWSTDELKKTPAMTMRLVMPGIEFIETANPANVEYVLKTKFEDYTKGEWFRSNLFDVFGNGMLNVDGSAWKLQRKVAMQEFNTRTLRVFLVQVVQSELKSRMVPILESFCDKHEDHIDLQDLLLRFTFDTICQLAFGMDFGGLEMSLPSIPFAKAFDDAVINSTLRFWSTFPPWKFKKYFNIGSEKILKDSLSVINEFASTVIQTRREEISNGQGDHPRLDLLSRFMHVADEAVMGFKQDPTLKLDIRNKAGDQASDLFLRDIVISFVLAGRDTSASGLTWFFWLLSQNPRVESAILREIQATIASRKASETKTSDDGGGDDDEFLFSFEELKEMHYLSAALTESMRIYPPVPDDSKESEVDDVLPDGTRVCKGTRISIQMYAMGRNHHIWGDDFLEFRPERFIEDGVFVPPSPFKYPVFFAGPRICIGKDMAMIQMKLIAAALIYMYTFEVRQGHRVQYDWNLTMKIQEGLPVRVRRRR